MGRAGRLTEAIMLLFLLSASLPVGAESGLTLVAENDWAPYSSGIDQDAQGISVDIVRAAYASQNIAVTFKVMPYARGMKYVADGEEVGVFNTTRTSEIEQSYRWHRIPVLRARSVYFAPADHPDRPVVTSDLVGRSVGITNGYTYADAFEHMPGINRDISSTDLQTLKKLAVGRIDYGVIYEMAANYLISQNADLRGRVKMVGVLADEPIYISFSLKHPAAALAAEQLDRGLEAIMADGTYEKIWSDWHQRLK